VVILAVVGLGVQAVRGNRTVSVQRSAHTIRDASLDNAFYSCIAIQAHSLVMPGQSIAFRPPVTLTDFGTIVTLLKAVGSWATLADPPSSAAVTLNLRNYVAGPGACLGTQVIGIYPHAHHKVTVRIGSGASVAGKGPPPAPPL